MPNTISLFYSTTMLFCPTNLLTTKITSDFLLQHSEFYFLFPVTPPPPPPPMGFYFCLPSDEATAKSVKNNSPTDSEKQTAVASKDKRLFLTKLLLCQILTMLVNPPPVSASEASNGVCSVCVNLTT